MPLLGTRRYPQLLRGAFSSPPLSISLPRLAFSAVPSRLLAQHWRLPHLLTSQAAAPGQAEDSYRPASPLLSPLTPVSGILDPTSPPCFLRSRGWQCPLALQGALQGGVFASRQFCCSTHILVAEHPELVLSLPALTTGPSLFPRHLS